MLAGVALLALVAMRALALWRETGSPGHGNGNGHNHSHEPGQACCHDHDHSHDHAHGHVHDHAHDHAHGPDCGHDHGHHTHDPEEGIQVNPGPLAAKSAGSLEPPAPEAPAPQAHGHDHGHDHEHGWAPWRYAVLLLPIMLYLLYLTRLEASGPDVKEEVAKRCALLASASPLQTLATYQALLTSYGGDVDFKTLEGAAATEEDRKIWQGRTVQVRGEFRSRDSTDKMFDLIRFKIQCCRADVIPLRVVIVCGESVAGIQNNQWVEVVGQIDFLKQPGQDRYVTLLKVTNRSAIKPTKPDYNPYVQ
jgi:hypothetical protein